MAESGFGVLREDEESDIFGRRDAVFYERDASAAAASEAISMMLHLQGEKADAVNMEGGQYLGFGDSESDIQALKDAVCTQQILLQKLSAELDEEREASASAASEALAMILRLQGEKAAVTMEASQYKRIAEEKISHAEECLALFEDVIYQKEMEIASLEYHIQAYRCKLLSLGGNDLGFFENTFPDSLLFQKNETSSGEMGVYGNVRRMNSLPAIKVMDSYQKKTERKKSASSASELILGAIGESKSPESDVRYLDLGKKKVGNSEAKDVDLCLEFIKKLNGQVKKTPHGENFSKNRSKGLKVGARLPPLDPNTFSSSSQARHETSSKDQNQSAELRRKIMYTGNAACSSNVLDVFEIPKHDNVCEDRASGMKEQSDVLVKGDDRMGKPDVVLDGTCKFQVKDETEWVKTMHEHELSKARDMKRVDCTMAHIHTGSAAGEFREEFQQLCQRINRLEEETNIRGQEITEERAEELQLLKEIREQLNSIQSEIQSSRTRKTTSPTDSQLDSIQSEIQSSRTRKNSCPYDSQLDPLKDAMLYFWL